MSTKTIGIYASGTDNALKNNDELIVEIGNSHLACMVKKGSKHLITAFELFDFDKDEANDFNDLFTGVSSNSQLINRTFASTRIYINNELALLVPVFKFNKEISGEYLNVVFGEDPGARKQFEHVNTEPDLMNVFRMPGDWFNVINNHLISATIHHSYTQIVRRVLASPGNSSSPTINVQLYPAHLIVTVVKHGTLQFIQSFTYQSPEDILYYLLNISQRFQVNTHELSMAVSGAIDLHSSLHNDLLKYFRNISIEDVDHQHFDIDRGQQPSHYLTPFFNLAV